MKTGDILTEYSVYPRVFSTFSQNRERERVRFLLGSWEPEVFLHSPISTYGFAFAGIDIIPEHPLDFILSISLAFADRDIDLCNTQLIYPTS
ncbi:MAG: hypothetical protein H8D65_01200 [Spirochaetes bacterium]|nr:hypothetical protein [Spirochaetota bacterium]MBL7006738.1 hypothetical protein [Spirochaetia bacterium]